MTAPTDANPLLTTPRLEGAIEPFLAACGPVVWEFRDSDSGCRSIGVQAGERRWFVKYAQEGRAVAGLRRAVAVNRAVRHQALPSLRNVIECPAGPVLVYDWVAGEPLRHDDVRRRFAAVPLAQAAGAVTTLLDLHERIAEAGFVAVDLYDGCLLYDFAAARLWVCDLDEYRPGPFELQIDRLPGSTRSMAPEEWVRGSLIDEVTNVYVLGRLAAILLGDRAGRAECFRGGPALWSVVERAIRPDRARRFVSVREFVNAWHGAWEYSQGGRHVQR